MKGLKIIIVSLLISFVNSDHNIERSNRIERYDLSDSSESDEDNNQCKEFGSDSVSTGDPKILFDIFLPESIRYMEESKFDVMIYNKLSSKKPVDVEVNILDSAENNKFRFFNNKSDQKNEPVFTKITTVPFGRPQYVSFFIQTSDKKEMNVVMNITIKASVKSENYECYLTKPVNVKLPAIKIYHNLESTFNLIPTRDPYLMPITPFNPYDSARIEGLRMSVEVSGHRNKLNKVDFSVTISNKNDFNKVIHVTTEDDPIEIILPENTTTAEASIKGTGFCIITVITQRAFKLFYLDPKFNLEIARLPTSRHNEAIVRVCASYAPKRNEFQIIQEVIYDVEMPKGYVYKEVIDKSKIKVVKSTLYTFKFPYFFLKFNSLSNQNGRSLVSSYFSMNTKNILTIALIFEHKKLRKFQMPQMLL